MMLLLLFLFLFLLLLLLLLLSLTSDILSADLFRSLCCYVKCQRFSFWVKLSLQITDLRSSCVLCFRAVTTPQTWMIWPTYINIPDESGWLYPYSYLLPTRRRSIHRLCQHMASVACGFGRSWCASETVSDTPLAAAILGRCSTAVWPCMHRTNAINWPVIAACFASVLWQRHNGGC